MTDDRSETIETMRKRYLHEYKSIHKKSDCIAFFKEIGEMAEGANALAWKKFANGMLACLQDDMETGLALFEEAIALDPNSPIRGTARASSWQSRSATTRRWRPSRRPSRSTPKMPPFITTWACGSGGRKDLAMLRRRSDVQLSWASNRHSWNSFSPLLRRDLRDQDSPGPDERLGGGYFLVWKGHGIAIDPGVDFVTQLYRRGLSIADVDAVIITHCHLDHTRDVESLVDLNYRYNRAKGFKPHPPNKDFRQLHFFASYSAFIKYSEYLINSGCCDNPQQLERDGRFKQIGDFIKVQAVPTQHKDIDGRDDKAIGLVFVLKDESEEVARVGITSDSKWMDSLAESFSGCDVLVAHMGTIEIGEEKAATGEKGEDAAETGGFLKTDLKNHLGTKGCFRLLQRAKPKIFVMGEFGEELVETRFKIIQVFHKLKPNETSLVLGGDSNLAIGLGKELSVCCSHPECARSWRRIPLDQVRPVLGGDYLFQYICPEHGIGAESGG